MKVFERLIQPPNKLDSEFERLSIPPTSSVYQVLVPDGATSNYKEGVRSFINTYIVPIPADQVKKVRERFGEPMAGYVSVMLVYPDGSFKHAFFPTGKFKLKCLRQGVGTLPINDVEIEMESKERKGFEVTPDACNWAEICDTVNKQTSSVLDSPCTKCTVCLRNDGTGFLKSYSDGKRKYLSFSAKTRTLLEYCLRGKDIKSLRMPMAFMIVLLESESPMTMKEISDACGYDFGSGATSASVRNLLLRSGYALIRDKNKYSIVKVNTKDKSIKVDDTEDGEDPEDNSL